ncbi:hypothetical protein M5585_02330 [Serratia ureilytica]
MATARRGDRLQALADEVERQGARPQAIVADVTEPEALARLAAQALRGGDSRYSDQRGRRVSPHDVERQRSQLG